MEENYFQRILKVLNNEELDKILARDCDSIPNKKEDKIEVLRERYYDNIRSFLNSLKHYELKAICEKTIWEKDGTTYSLGSSRYSYILIYRITNHYIDEIDKYDPKQLKSELGKLCIFISYLTLSDVCKKNELPTFGTRKQLTDRIIKLNPTDINSFINNNFTKDDLAEIYEAMMIYDKENKIRISLPKLSRLRKEKMIEEIRYILEAICVDKESFREKIDKIVSEASIKIVTNLLEGTPPWRKPWTRYGFPVNLSTMKEYRGINVLMLMSSIQKNQCRYFVTEKQCENLGGRINPNAKAHKTFFYSNVFVNTKREEKHEEEKPVQENSINEKKLIPIFREFVIYNVADTTGLEKVLNKKDKPQNNDPILSCESFIKKIKDKPSIFNSKLLDEAFYREAIDEIELPTIELFSPKEAYYSTLFHELAHSTGHHKRLNRETLVNYHRHEKHRAEEEIIVEMASSFIAAYLQIDNATIDNNSAYINSWIKQITDDPFKVFSYAGKAQKAFEFLLNRIETKNDERYQENLNLFENI